MITRNAVTNRLESIDPSDLLSAEHLRQWNFVKKIVGYFFLFFLFFGKGSLFAQNKDTTDALLKIDVSIVGKGFVDFGNTKGDVFFTLIRLTNKQDTTINVPLWTCSWPVFNFVDNSDSIALIFIGCDRNFPLQTKLQSKESIEFYAGIRMRPGLSYLKKIKLGFIHYEIFENDHGWYLKNMLKLKHRIVWSEEFTVSDNLLKGKHKNFVF
jgi:hypothetical protein